MPDLSTPIEIARPAIIEFGGGLVSAAGRWARARGLGRTLVVSDAFNAARVGLLDLPGEVTVFGEVKPEPDLPNLEKVLALAEQVKPDLVIGFGGGSAMDLAKLVAVLPDSGQSFAEVVGTGEGERPQGGTVPGSHHLRHRQRGRHPVHW
jgi:alcohol dehydrogenase class IV